jgi:hypothetical protein
LRWQLIKKEAKTFLGRGACSARRRNYSEAENGKGSSFVRHRVGLCRIVGLCVRRGRQRTSRRHSADRASVSPDHLPAGRNAVPANIDNVRVEADGLPDRGDDLPSVPDKVSGNRHAVPAIGNEMSAAY